MMKRHQSTPSLRERFESHLPKYGNMWRQMASRHERNQQKCVAAIGARQPVSIHFGCPCPFENCDGCQDPIIEEPSPLSQPSSVLSESVGRQSSDSACNERSSPQRKTPPLDDTTSVKTKASPELIEIDFSNLMLKDDDQQSAGLPSANGAKGSLIHGFQEPLRTDLDLEEYKEEARGTTYDRRSPQSIAHSVQSSSDSSDGNTVLHFDLSYLVNDEREQTDNQQFESNVNLSTLQIADEEGHLNDLENDRVANEQTKENSSKAFGGVDGCEDLEDRHENGRKSRESAPREEGNGTVDDETESTLSQPYCETYERGGDERSVGQDDSDEISNTESHENPNASYSSSGGSTAIKFDLSYLMDGGEEREDISDEGYITCEENLVDSRSPPQSGTGTENEAIAPHNEAESERSSASDSYTEDSWLVKGASDASRCSTNNDDPSVFDLCDTDSLDDTDREQDAPDAIQSIPQRQLVDSEEEEWQSADETVDNGSSVPNSPTSSEGAISADENVDPQFRKAEDLQYSASSKVSSRRKRQTSKGIAFRRNRKRLTEEYFSEFNRTVFRSALTPVVVSWSNKLRTTAGLTRLKTLTEDGRPATRLATIELSTKVIDDTSRLRSTLLHEMCHAAAWLVDNVVKPPHGRCFKKWASRAMQKVGTIQ